MQKYIALLRGINVGGKNIVSMPLLKAVFEAAGFYNVSTYINSGNLFFSSYDTDMLVLQQRCVQLIAENFKLNIPVAVISSNALTEALGNAPEWWDRTENCKHNAIFVIAPVTAEAMVKEIGEIKPEYEQLDNYGQVIFWSAPIATFSRTRLSKFVSATSCASITIRNANTTKKLLQLSK